MSLGSGRVTYIGAKELANLLSSPENASTVVIDVRDEVRFKKQPTSTRETLLAPVSNRLLATGITSFRSLKRYLQCTEAVSGIAASTAWTVLQDFGDGGSIVGAANITSDNFRRPEGLDAIIEAHCGPSVQNVVIHCALSQVRGPRAANSLADALLAHGRTLPSIRVLQGGFIHFAKQFHDNPSLVALQ